MNEAETRAEYIDPTLKAAGWGVVESSRILREHGITQGRDCRLCAGVPQHQAVHGGGQGLRQALHRGCWPGKSYAAKLAVRFAYATNGQRIYGIDMAKGLEADVAQYPSPDELWSQTFAEADVLRAGDGQ